MPVIGSPNRPGHRSSTPHTGAGPDTNPSCPPVPATPDNLVCLESMLTDAVRQKERGRYASSSVRDPPEPPAAPGHFVPTLPDVTARRVRGRLRCIAYRDRGLRHQPPPYVGPKVHPVALCSSPAPGPAGSRRIEGHRCHGGADAGHGGLGSDARCGGLFFPIAAVTGYLVIALSSSSQWALCDMTHSPLDGMPSGLGTLRIDARMHVRSSARSSFTLGDRVGGRLPVTTSPGRPGSQRRRSPRLRQSCRGQGGR